MNGPTQGYTQPPPPHAPYASAPGVPAPPYGHAQPLRYQQPTQPVQQPQHQVYPSNGGPGMYHPQPPVQQQPYTNNVNQLTAKFSNVTLNKSWNQMWGNESVNLMTEKNIKSKPSQLPPKEDDGSCSREVMCCTLGKVPETASILQKSRLPFGILIHPFKDDDVSGGQGCVTF